MPRRQYAPTSPCVCDLSYADHLVIVGGKYRPTGGCGDFRAAKAKAGKNSRKRGIQTQLDWTRATSFVNREGHGLDCLYLGPDGHALVGGEHKHKRSFTWGQVEEAMQQAESYCPHESGKPLPCVGYTTKEGTGKAARRYLILRAEDFPRLIERLTG